MIILTILYRGTERFAPVLPQDAKDAIFELLTCNLMI